MNGCFSWLRHRDTSRTDDRYHRLMSRWLGLVIVIVAIAFAIREGFAVVAVRHETQRNVGAVAAALQALPTPPQAVTTSDPADSRGTPMSKNHLALLLDQNPFPGRWSCSADRSGRWDYICRQPQLRETWGYHVGPTKITSSAELTYAGRALVP